MSRIPVDETLTEWDAACATNDRERWIEHLDRVPVCDFFPVLIEREALALGTKQVTLSQWLNHMGSRRPSDIEAEPAGNAEPRLRLATATYLRWADRIEKLLRESLLPHLPDSGFVQYFSDHLAVAILIGYQRIGSTIELNQSLAIPNPESYLDPLRVLRIARTPQQLDLLRRSLYSRHKVLIQRNTLIHIDRERASDVFGPAIDTLFLNDWLHAHRYARQRTIGNSAFFEDPLPRHATVESSETGSSFVEIGCGNGLLTASFARNEAKVKSLAVIDVSPAAVSATYENVATQRQLHLNTIASRGRFTIGRYMLNAMPSKSDLVVCNPPYLPIPPNGKVNLSHPLATATIGTELLEQVLHDSDSLIAPHGEMYMVSSTLAEPEIKASIPSGLRCDRLASRTVPFDIEAVRDIDDAYINWLCDDRGLQRAQSSLFHTIAIYRIANNSHPFHGETQ